MKLFARPLAIAFAALAFAGAASAQYDERYDDYERYESYERDADYARDDRAADERRYERDDHEPEAEYGDEASGDDFGFARVLDVQPILDIQSRPVERQECREQPVSRNRHAASRAPDPGIIASVLGQPSDQGVPATTRRCVKHTEYVEAERITGYDVTYRYRGRTYRTVMARAPGDRVLVQAN